jgi:hypothetical protein
MSDLTPDQIVRLRALAAEATPGPWFYNGYSGVFSAPLTQVYDDLEDFECKVPEYKESCGDGPCSGCPFFEHEYRHGPLVVHVPAHHGDTAIGRHAADGAFIAEACSLIPALLDEIERLRAVIDDVRAEGEPINNTWGACSWCAAHLEGGANHKPDCAWLKVEAVTGA